MRLLNIYIETNIKICLNKYVSRRDLMEDAHVLSPSKFHDYPRIEYLKIHPTAYYQFEIVSIIMNFVLVVDQNNFIYAGL
jgi:hypothetical protein